MHISDIKKFTRCPLSYKKSLDSTPVSHTSFFNVCADTTVSVANKLQIEDYAIGQPNQTSEDSFNIAQQHKWIFKARFNYRDLRVRIPLIYIEDNHCKLFFIYLLNSVSSDELKNIKMHMEVIRNNNLIIDEVQIIHLNKDYVREDQLDDDKLWVIETTTKNNENTIIEKCNEIEVDLDSIIDSMTNLQDYTPVRNSMCSSRNKCEYYNECFPQESNVEPNSILTLVSSQHKHKMYESGIKYLKDADEKLVEGSRLQFAQIMADKNGGRFIDRMGLDKWLKKNVKFPLSFIDFEWDLYPVPPYKGMKPLDVLMFQYSLHVYDGKELKHYQYVGTGDDRLELAKSMMENLPDEGTIFAYNAKGAEMVRISELANTFTEYSEKLNQINSRMVDMADPFISGLFYDTALGGNFTLKQVEEIIDAENSYHDLEVANGMEAVLIHRLIEKCTDSQQIDLYKEQLYKYCGLDSYSLYKAYCFLSEL